jgi:hypothetical protein
MPLRLLLAALAAALLSAAPAMADTTTILDPGDRTPVTIPGAKLKRGDRLADGEHLLRRLTDVRAGTIRIVTLRCPSGTRHAGLGVFETANDVGFSVVGGNYVGHRNVRVRAYAASSVEKGTLVRASIFALCRTP